MRYSEADSYTQMSLVYQPLVEMSEVTTIYGVEAFLRLNSGLPLLPRLSYAETSGEIAAIDDWVLRNACEQVAGWCHRGRLLRLSLNISGYQLEEENFPARLEKILNASRLSPLRLALEISPRYALENSGTPATVLCRLKEMGISLIRDNFGTMRAGMADLRHPYLTGVKVSTSLVTSVVENEASRVMLTGIRDVCRSSHKQLQVSGVEGPCQRDVLIEMGIHLQQGYLFGGPVTRTMFQLFWPG
jgi:EAL domain-containing protein (putative c-di-GMP-specific phosphodiesterase class I)